MSKPRPPLNDNREVPPKIGDLLGVSFHKTQNDPEKEPVQDRPPIAIPKKLRTPAMELWISKAGRAGKAVTLIKGGGSAPEKEAINFRIKKSLGVGGSVKNGEIVIQSAERGRIGAILAEMGWASKMCGG